MGLLPRKTILQIHKTTVRLGLSRGVLLVGIEPAFVATIPAAPDVASQLLCDLDKLNQTEQLVDGTVPLRIWLENAHHLSDMVNESKIFQQAIDTLDKPSPPPSLSTRSSPQRAAYSTNASKHEFDDDKRELPESEFTLLKKWMFKGTWEDVVFKFGLVFLGLLVVCNPFILCVLSPRLTLPTDAGATESTTPSESAQPDQPDAAPTIDAAPPAREPGNVGRKEGDGK